MEAVDVFKRIGDLKIVPVVAIDEVAAALPLADALLEGHVPVVEITFRTSAAAHVIQVIVRERSEMLVGAGTVLTVDSLRRAADCGATFGVAPGLKPEITREALRISFPFMPGVMTPSDIEDGLSLGFKVLKFFPAGASAVSRC